MQTSICLFYCSTLGGCLASWQPRGKRMERYKIHFENLSKSSVQLTLIPSDRTDDALRQDLEEHGVIIGEVIAHSLIGAKREIVKLIERWR